jgi:curved DNA-binding protein CbpA
MADSFDPYLQWLSITDPERPPNHYRLLGLELFEQEMEAIWNATMQHMALVLRHDPGPHCEAARRIFDELEIARSCLSDPQRKRKYDESLRQHLRNVEA